MSKTVFKEKLIIYKLFVMSYFILCCESQPVIFNSNCNNHLNEKLNRFKKKLLHNSL